MRGTEELFIQPQTLSEAQELLKELPENFLILAGGTDLFVSLREKGEEDTGLFSLCMIPELKKIEKQNGWLKVGSMVTHTQASEDPFIIDYFHALAMACAHVGSCQIRNKGTLGGNIMNGSPAGDILPCICLFDGELEFLGTAGFRRESVFAFLQKKKEERVRDREILTGIYLPVPEDKKTDSIFLKLGGREEVTIAQISLCVRWQWVKEEKKNVEAYMGAVDTKPVLCNFPSLLEGREIGERETEKMAEVLSSQITELRKKRKRQPKLKITEAERLYKERAVRGLLYDLKDEMNQRRG